MAWSPAVHCRNVGSRSGGRASHTSSLTRHAPVYIGVQGLHSDPLFVLSQQFQNDALIRSYIMAVVRGCGSDYGESSTHVAGANEIQTVNGYDSSTFNSVQGYATFVNYFKEDGNAKIDPNIIGAVNTGEYPYALTTARV